MSNDKVAATFHGGAADALRSEPVRHAVESIIDREMTPGAGYGRGPEAAAAEVLAYLCLVLGESS